MGAGSAVVAYEDHIRLWADELLPWLPGDIFDTHVHLGPPGAMGPYSAERSREPLCTFSDLPRHPSLWLEMSSASRVEVYARTLARSELWGRLLFGSDVPYGLITGVEAWSEETGPVFLTRDRYAWSDASVNRKFGGAAERLTYNTYHTIKALKDALEALALDRETAETIKRQVFCDNAVSLFT